MIMYIDIELENIIIEYLIIIIKIANKINIFYNDDFILKNNSYRNSVKYEFIDNKLIYYNINTFNKIYIFKSLDLKN